jgi:ElaB/YqjD/DUF883 family membrane-anchored ribosome-binding protein
MPADRVLSRELKSLQDELSAARRERAVQGAPASGMTPSGETAAPAGRHEESAEESELRGELRDLVKEITDFAEDAEQTISAHPAMSIVAAMLLGILIGSLLGRR